MTNGLVHIYTGDGKGKTTASVGLAVRAYGSGLRVLFIQFLKGRDTGELHVLDQLGPRLSIRRQDEVKKFIWEMNEGERAELRSSVGSLFDYARSAVSGGDWDLVVIDELMGVISIGMLRIDEVLSLIKEKAEPLELVLTGRNAPQELIEAADYVSEIKAVRHPFEKGITARKGIEF